MVAPIHRRGGSGRADLLIALQTQEALPEWVPLAGAESGFARRVMVSESRLPPADWRGPSASSEPAVVGEAPAVLKLPSLWIVESQRQIEQSDAPDLPDDVSEALSEPARPSFPAPDPAEVQRAARSWLTAGVQQRWPQLRTRLRSILGLGAEGAIDWRRLIDQLAAGESVQRLPRRQWPRWPGGLRLAMDFSAALQPFHFEWRALHSRLGRQLGPALQSCAFERRDGRLHWHKPNRAGGQILLLSDLGEGDLAHGDAYTSWLQREVRAGARLWCLAPQARPLPAARKWSTRLAWSVRAPAASEVETLLALLAGFGAGSDLLLRALAPLVAPVGTILDLSWRVWNHSALTHYGRLCAVTGAEWLERFAVLPLGLLQQALARAAPLIASRSVQDAHQLALRLHALVPELVPDIRPARQFLLDLGSQIREARLDARGALEQAGHELLAATLRPTRLQLRPELRRLQRLASAERLRTAAPLTRFAELGPVGFAREPATRGLRTLFQVGNELELAGTPSKRGLPMVSMWLELDDDSQLGLTGVVSTGWSRSDLGRLPDSALRVELLAGSRIYTLARIERPAWASGFGRDERDAYALAPPLGAYQHRFELPERKTRHPEGLLALRDVENRLEFELPETSAASAAPGIGDRFEPTALGPEWAIGVDRYGCFASLSVGGVEQRFRWIPPGRFWMGSPKAEQGRFADEGPQHEVTLSQGFWLADTACSQAFWLAVVGGENPAGFSDDPACPVEQVSWEEVMQRFVPALQAQLEPGVAVDLPTEAEWEYACRAGTQTPFHYGESLSAAQANFDGTHPYGGAESGEYRLRTVPVKLFEPNAWGLCQMHGNVWEWCRDGRRTYAEAAVTDPEGPLETGLRALRGGSWLSDARSLRAAYRNVLHAGYRSQSIGFRCVLRSSPSKEPSPGSGPEVRAGSTAGGTPAVSSRDAERPATLMQRLRKLSGRQP